MSRAKAVYFMRTTNDVLTKTMTLRQYLVYGDISYSPVDHLNAFVEEVGQNTTMGENGLKIQV